MPAGSPRWRHFKPASSASIQIEVGEVDPLPHILVFITSLVSHAPIERRNSCCLPRGVMSLTLQVLTFSSHTVWSAKVSLSTACFSVVAPATRAPNSMARSEGVGVMHQKAQGRLSGESRAYAPRKINLELRKFQYDLHHAPERGTRRATAANPFPPQPSSPGAAAPFHGNQARE